MHKEQIKKKINICWFLSRWDQWRFHRGFSAIVSHARKYIFSYAHKIRNKSCQFKSACFLRDFTMQSFDLLVTLLWKRPRPKREYKVTMLWFLAWCKILGMATVRYFGMYGKVITRKPNGSSEKWTCFKSPPSLNL